MPGSSFLSQIGVIRKVAKLCLTPSKAQQERAMSTAQTIFRVASRHKPYAQIGNAMLRDKRLSMVARSALAMILSYPPDWIFNIHWLCKEADIGRNKARAIIRELEEYGYCQRSQIRNEDGTLGRATLIFYAEASTYPNAERTEQKRSFTLTWDELKFMDPAPITRGTTVAVLKRLE
jgi:hypothetical protein